MKKYIIALGVAVLIGASAFTVYTYNKGLKEKEAAELKLAEEKRAEEERKKEEQKSNEESKEKETQENGSKDNKEAASDFKLKDLSGKEVSLSDFKGKKIFLNFWASWCPPCKAEMPDMEKLYQETKDSDLVILAVNIGEGRPTASKFIKENKLNFPVLLDDTTAIALKYEVASIPTSYFIDKDGNISAKHIGMMSYEKMKSFVDNIK
ncbi:TlpA disulfide reductase family protein [Clostridium polynesiense]|uniref:TlpA disulfide reductase family protein n=1 Tax=Clostridium polynesiense TaxID=1325933 RepID=UPI0005902BF4|nr:TlpA disulfide reductase family protein [Clostridium polynesiense]